MRTTSFESSSRVSLGPNCEWQAFASDVRFAGFPGLGFRVDIAKFWDSHLAQVPVGFAEDSMKFAIGTRYPVPTLQAFGSCMQALRGHQRNGPIRWVHAPLPSLLLLLLLSLLSFSV